MMLQPQERTVRRSVVTVVFLSIVISAPGLCPAQETTGPLAEYVAAPDDSYAWKVRRRGALGATSYVELTLTSQTWRGIAWKHQLFVVKPSTAGADCSHAMLVIAGSSWKDKLEKPAKSTELPRSASMFALLAEQLRTPVAILLHVPFQPMFGGKREDQLIAMSFDKYLRTGDDRWPLLLPMVKSAVRAMDTVQQFAADQWSLKLQTFTVSGASKRGWTTWLTGAVDRRATALVPIVIDMLKIGPQLKHQKAAWGAVSPQIGDYTKLDLPRRLDTDAGRTLQAIVDPYHYRQQLRQPKLIMIGTNDHFWPLDALNLYWDDLVGPKHIVYVPNNRHGITDFVRLTGSLIAMHRHATEGKPLPELSWKFVEGDRTVTLRVTSKPPPQRVDFWAASSKTRDFRKSRWFSQPCEADGDGHVGTMSLPEAGWSAYFGEAVFASDGIPYFLSTNVKILSTAGSEVEVAK